MFGLLLLPCQNLPSLCEAVPTPSETRVLKPKFQRESFKHAKVDRRRIDELAGNLATVFHRYVTTRRRKRSFVPSEAVACKEARPAMY